MDEFNSIYLHLFHPLFCLLRRFAPYPVPLPPRLSPAALLLISLSLHVALSPQTPAIPDLFFLPADNPPRIYPRRRCRRRDASDTRSKPVYYGANTHVASLQDIAACRGSIFCSVHIIFMHLKYIFFLLRSLLGRRSLRRPNPPNRPGPGEGDPSENCDMTIESRQSSSGGGGGILYYLLQFYLDSTRKIERFKTSLALG